MTTSTIEVSALTGTPTLRGNKLAWTVTATGPAATIPNIMLDAVEVHASTTNDRATATKVGEANNGSIAGDFQHAGLIEEAIWYYWIRARDKLGNFGDWHPSSATAGVSAATKGAAAEAFTLSNGKIVTSAAANAATIAIKTQAGTDPSANNPVFLAFRSVGPDSGSYRTLAITSALSITIPAGETLGSTSAVPCRFWVVIFDDDGTLRLGVTNQTNDFSVLWFYKDEDTASIGTLLTGSTRKFIYTGTAIATPRHFRYVGYVEWNNLATAGQYDRDADVVMLVGPNTHLPGSIVQRNIYKNASYVSGALAGATLIPLDDTIPTATEGVSLFSHFFTASSVNNIIEFEIDVPCSHSVASMVALSARFTTEGSFHVGVGDVASANALCTLRVSGVVVGTASDEIAVRGGASNAGTFAMNGSSGGRKFGGSLKAVSRITEIMG